MIRFVFILALFLSGCSSAGHGITHGTQADGTLLEHLVKYKKYPAGPLWAGIGGLNRLLFVIDANGNVLYYELIQSSGNADLDEATLEMIRRAQPLPKPPAEMLKNGSVEIVMPVVYSVKRPI